jgi:phosphoribosylformylglycinamidine synthase
VRVWVPDGLDPFVFLFSESQARAVVAVPRSEEVRFTDMCTARRFPHQRIGVLDDGDPDSGPVIDVQGQFSVAIEELRSLQARRLPDAMA